MALTITKFAHLQIPLEDILNATNNFADDNIIGHGGFGPAYKGRLLRSGKLINIAAKRLDRKLGEGDVEFWTEVSMLSDLKHTNLVSIIGFCDEKDEKIIITTYEAKGSLKEYLNSPNLTWTQRLRVSVGVARALSYLHHDEGRGYAVIHRNINSSTILLDEKWEAKLSGFEISIKQSFNRMHQVILCEPIGTPGYVDPEIEKTKGVTNKSDTYSLGVVLFEILCGRRAYIKNEANLARLAKHHYEDETLHDIIHPELRNQMSRGSLRKYSKIAYYCLMEVRAHRPHMLDIVDELEKALEKALKFQPRPKNFGKNLEHLKIRLDDIKLATKNFSDTYIVESGNYYTWYTTELGHFDKKELSFVEGKSKSEILERQKTIEIKRFLPKDDEHDEQLFFTELEMLSTVKHRNIVTLIGFCVESFEMMLVLEKFSNGCLRDYLGNVENMRTLTWERRLKICIDVAFALNYLHSEMEGKKMIIHSNISNAKFQLDENWGAKIDDFEWAVFLPHKKEEVLCKRTYFGSKYYVDPEYAKTNKLKRESDVYSFGVVMFEILCGRHADDHIYLKENENGLVHVVRRNFRMEKMEDMIDPTLKEETNEKRFPSTGIVKDSLYTFLKVAHQCVAETHDKRPTMNVVLKELKKALFLQEERVQQSGKDHVVGEVEKARHKIHHEGAQHPNTKKPLELQLAHVITETYFEHLKIPLSHIKLATNDFSNTYKIEYFDGCTLYRAELDHYDKENQSPKRNNVVLIKRYHFGHHLFGEEAFFTEIEMLGSVKHPNIVNLLGFCVEASEMILVIDNLSNGFLGDYLRNYNEKHLLTWEKRLKICIDVAHALRYIHYEMEDQKIIINRDINCYNIGLDENWEAKIVDFWWSVYLSPSQEDGALYLNSIGRPSYIDPEYGKENQLKRESDVYSFGIVLFEVLCGKVAYDPVFKKEKDKGLADVARRSFCTGTLKDMIDPIIKEESCEDSFVLNIGPTKESLYTFFEIAYQCVVETQKRRPTMKVVVKELEKALYFQRNKDNPKISLEEINHATKNFHNANCIGGGGFGNVYIGNLRDEDGFKTIVAKRLDTRFGQGEQQFLTELQILLEYKHENVIGLVGYCDERNEKIIVYEYAPKGSLDRHLNNVSLTWVERLHICIDVASALYFFHEGIGKQAKVIHRDIKSANILLKHNWKAKLADFGLSLISPLTHETDYLIDHAYGTPGYLDPLYKKSRFLTIESDIYSFGVVLFEILCGRSTFVIHKHEGVYLPDFIKNIFEEGKHEEIVLEKIREQIDPRSLTTFQTIAYQCLHYERQKRPTTKEVLMQLKKALAFQNMASTITKCAPLQIPLEDVLKATNNFHHNNIIGHSGFGPAYKGRLFQSGNLINITARRLDRKQGLGDLEFWNEVTVLSELNHTNVVSIVGFCDEKDEKIIVTMYEVNGSLGHYLNSPNLTWMQRLRICVGVARALSYLHYHQGRDYAIMHRIINSDTVLLDENWEAKLSSFEYSIKQLYKDEVHLCEPIGVTGYMDPSITKTGGVTHKSDIYSFGVLLYEILCGRKAYIHSEPHTHLAPFARYHYEKKALHDIILPELWNQMAAHSLSVYSNAGYYCLEEEPAHRPNMDYIVGELEKALFLEVNSEVKSDYVEEKSHASIIERQVLGLSSELSSVTMTSKSENSGIHNKEHMLLDQTDDSTESGCCMFAMLQIFKMIFQVES